jgi:hypothetical protein
VKNAAIAAASLLLHASSNLLLFAPNCWRTCGSDVFVVLFSLGGFEFSRRRSTPTVGISHVASHIHVAGAGRNAFSQRFLNDMQIARLALFEVNEKRLPEKEAALSWDQALGKVINHPTGVIGSDRRSLGRRDSSMACRSHHRNASHSAQAALISRFRPEFISWMSLCHRDSPSVYWIASAKDAPDSSQPKYFIAGLGFLSASSHQPLAGLVIATQLACGSVPDWPLFACEQQRDEPGTFATAAARYDGLRAYHCDQPPFKKIFGAIKRRFSVQNWGAKPA